MSNTDRDVKVLGYTKERLYELLPAIYRQQDEKLDKPLKGLLDVIAEQVAIIEKDIGDLYNNWFIETCDEWVTSYIADLMRARSLSIGRNRSVSNTQTAAFSQRAYVANTISYRRSKGTLAMLEQLSRDITQWNVRAIEFFQILDTTQYLNHLRLANLRTPDLRNTSELELLNTPFDDISHTVDVRRISSGRGYYNIENIGIFLWRLQAFPSISTPAFNKNNNDKRSFTFNPLGYDDIPIFNFPVTETSSSHIAEEINVPSSIRMRALYDNLESYYGKDKSIYITLRYAGEGKRRIINARDIVVCNLSEWHPPPSEDKVAIDPSRGRIAFSKDVSDVHATYYYGFSGKIGGGFYSRPQPRSDFIDRKKPTIYKVSKYGAFTWNNIPAIPSDTNHLKDFLRNNFALDWITDELQFTKSDDGKIIILSKDTNLLSITLKEIDAILEVNGQTIFNFFVKINEKNNGKICISKESDMYESISDALIWWKRNKDQDAVFEIVDSEIYDESIDLIMPVGSKLVIRAQQEKRPIIIGSLKVQGEKDSSLILDGLWIDINNNDNFSAYASLVKVGPGDMKSLIIRHCTLVPEREEENAINAKKKIALNLESYIRRHLFTWENIDENNRLKDFLRNNFALDWITDDTKLKKDTEPGTHKEYIEITNETESVRIYLEDGSGAQESSATLIIRDAQASEKKVYEFIVLTENGKKNLYVKDGNDDLKIVLDHTISGRIQILDSLLFSWDNIPANPNDNNRLKDFLRNNFALDWITNDLQFTESGDKKTISISSIDSSNSASITLGEKNTKATLTIGNKENVYEFIVRVGADAAGFDVFTQSEAELKVIDSIIDGKGNNHAIACRSATIQNTTVFGKTRSDELNLASNVIFTDIVNVKLRQKGCVRFSYVPEGSQTPRRYMCQPSEEKLSSSSNTNPIRIYPQFTSKRFGDPGYAQLGKNISSKIFEGADNGAEIGAFNYLYQPQRLKDLKSSLDEYLRFGLEAGVFLET
jgi:hypothetical protein